jgi:phosphatidylglycerophosphate synthase
MSTEEDTDKTAILAGFTPQALVPILGRSPFQRHLRHLSGLGVRRFLIPVSDSAPADVTPPKSTEALCRQQAAEVMKAPVDLVFTSPEGLAAALGTEAGGPVTIVAADHVIDPRLYRALFERAAFAADGPVWIGDGAAGSALVGAKPHPVGLRIAPTPSTSESLETLDGPRDEVLLVDDLDPYIPNLRRTLRPYWTSTADAAGRDRAAHMILDATQKGILDFPARYLHPPPENFLVRLFSPTPFTPNQITVFTGIIGFAATWLFATGSYTAGIVIALVVNVLDGVDGKLARVKLLASRFGDRLDHILDVLFEFSWYVGMGWGLSDGDPNGTPLRLGVGLIAVMLGTRGMSGVYKLISGRQIHDHRSFDRAFRLVAARRNIYVMTLVVGLAFGEVLAAFQFCFAWAVFTLLVYCGRTAVEALGWTGGRSNGEQTA